MKKIMLVCSAGMSTSLLVNKMIKVASDKGIEAEIFAISVMEFDKKIENEKLDVILLGPQVRFMKNEFEKKLASKNIPLDVINMSHYGMMDGEKVLNQALALIK